MTVYSVCPKCGKKAYGRDNYGNGFYCFPSQGGCRTKFPPKITKIKGIYSHIIPTSRFLKKEIAAFFHDYYIPAYEGGSDFSSDILKIKDHADDSIVEQISGLIAKDLDIIVTLCAGYLKERPIIMTVPRSKPDSYWKERELKFRPAVSRAINQSTWVGEKSGKSWFKDGVHYLQRIVPTQTTHRAHLKDESNIGPEPYVGITRDTCQLNGVIGEKRIILVDDIYTEAKGIDEDCIQYLLNSGAADVVLYTLGMTRHAGS